MGWPWHENKVFNINLFLLSIKFCLWFFFFRCFILSKLRFYSKACLNFNAICLMVLSVLLVQQKNGKKILKCLFLETTQVLSLLRFFFSSPVIFSYFHSVWFCQMTAASTTCSARGVVGFVLFEPMEHIVLRISRFFSFRFLLFHTIVCIHAGIL